MRVQIRNLGPVKEASILLRPLTIFVGPNNSGKTWTAYALGGTFGINGWKSHIHDYLNGQHTGTYQALEDVVQKLVEKGNTHLDMVDFCQQNAESYFRRVFEITPKWLATYLGARRTHLKNTEFGFSFDDAKASYLQAIESFEIEGRLSISKKAPKGLLILSKDKGNPKIYFHTEQIGPSFPDIPLKLVRRWVTEGIFQILHRSLFLDTYMLPTERSAFVPFPFGKAAVSLEQSLPESVTKPEEQEKPSIKLSGPVNNFFRMMNIAFETDMEERIEEANQNREISAYLDLATLLEKRVLKGEVSLIHREPFPQQEVCFEIEGGISLEMPLASSMVKELAPLVLYLRLLAHRNHLMVIDEPEMNLHPEAQACVTELLAMLVNAGVNLIITTHSPYLVDHLLNLIKASQLSESKASAKSLFLKRAEALIPQDKVAVYLFQKGTARSILDKDGLIDWQTFSDVSDRIHDLRFDLET